MVPSYDYEVTPPPAGSWRLHLEARFENAPGDRLVGAGGVTRVDLIEGNEARTLAPGPGGEGWLAPACRRACTVRYDVDLDALSAACRSMDCVRRVGDAVIGSAADWMLRPDPAGDAVIHVRLAGADASRFATGLRRDPRGGYELRGRELGEASYTAFGALRRAAIDVPGGRLDGVLLGAPVAMGDAAVVAWVKDAATCVARLYGRFPAQATVFVVPVPGADGVVFGRVLSLAGGSVVLLIGENTPVTAEHDDWVLVHELSHLGTPSFLGEAHWLEEGLATFYEPILRERAGWMREEQLWAHFVDQMPRGLRKQGEPPGLEERDDIDSTYWGGALFAFLADVKILSASGGARSLDDVLRAVHDRLGDATHATTLADFLRVGDEAAGNHALSDVYRAFAVQGEAGEAGEAGKAGKAGVADLDAMWRSLGVLRAADGSVTLSDDAPLAAVRRRIAAGGAH